MTLRRTFAFYCLTLCAVTALLLAMAACRVTDITPADATATYGAEMFHQQLTAEARGEERGE